MFQEMLKLNSGFEPWDRFQWAEFEEILDIEHGQEKEDRSIHLREWSQWIGLRKLMKPVQTELFLV